VDTESAECETNVGISSKLYLVGKCYHILSHQINEIMCLRAISHGLNAVRQRNMEIDGFLPDGRGHISMPYTIHTNASRGDVLQAARVT
jgi:hypothetical protein